MFSSPLNRNSLSRELLKNPWKNLVSSGGLSKSTLHASLIGILRLPLFLQQNFRNALICLSISRSNFVHDISLVCIQLSLMFWINIINSFLKTFIYWRLSRNCWTKVLSNSETSKWSEHFVHSSRVTIRPPNLGLANSLIIIHRVIRVFNGYKC